MRARGSTPRPEVNQLGRPWTIPPPYIELGDTHWIDSFRIDTQLVRWVPPSFKDSGCL